MFQHWGAGAIRLPAFPLHRLRRRDGRGAYCFCPGVRYRDARMWFRNVDSHRMNRSQRSASKIWQPVAVALGVTAMVVVLGCGDDTGLARRYKVSGKVTYKNEPVPHGTVNFIPVKPAPPEGRAAAGEIKDGVYTLSTAGDADGALPGEYNVAIVAVDVDFSSAVSKDSRPKIHEGDVAYQKAMKNAKKLIPDKYTMSETSGLHATVTTGSNNIDFTLKDE
jgi:hypothetical protein